MLDDFGLIASGIARIAMGERLVSKLSFEEARRLIGILINIDKRPYNNQILSKLELELVKLLEEYCKNYDNFTSEYYDRLIYLIEIIFGSDDDDSGYKETVRSFPVGYEEIIFVDDSDDEEERIKKKKKIMEARDYNERLRDRLAEWIFGILEMFRAKEIAMAKYMEEKLELKAKKEKNNRNISDKSGSGIAD